MIIKIQLSAIARDINKNGQPLAIALGMLVRAYQYAQDTNVDRWEFAIPIGEFRYAGVAISELRWLLFSGIAIHAQELIQAKGPNRRFMPLAVRSFPPDACFILSDQGVKSLEVDSRCSNEREILREKRGAILKIPANVDSLPRWNRSKLELTFQDITVKVFRSLAPNQELILSAFEEEHWPRRIDDPLPPEPEQDPRQRLRSAIKQLNRHQQNPVLRFRGDGSSRGVIWQSVK